MALNIDLWSTTPASNASLDGVSVAEGCPYANWNNAMRSAQAAIRIELMDIGSTVTAATLTTISGLSKRQPLGGSTTIDGFATAVTGMYRELPVINAPMLRNSATLALPDSIDRRLIAGDLIKATSLGAGSWVVKIDRQQDQEASATITAATLMDITVAKPFAQVSGSTTIDGFTTAVTGMYRELQFLGAPLIKYSGSLNLLPGDANLQLAANDIMRCRSLGAGKWINTVEKASGNFRETAVVANSSNLVIKYNAVTPNSKIDFTADEFLVKNASGTAMLLSTVNVTIDITVSGAAGLDTGAETGDAWYYVWGIAKDDGTISAIISLSSTAPTMPAGYTYKGLAGVIRNDGSAFRRSYQSGREHFVVPINALNAGNPGAANTYESLGISLQVPPMAKIAMGYAGSSDTGSDTSMFIAGDANGVGEVLHQSDGATVTANGYTGASYFRCPLITAQTIYWKMVTDASDAEITITGFVI